jgi:serine/threonine-protein kinase TNNI3K
MRVPNCCIGGHLTKQLFVPLIDKSLKMAEGSIFQYKSVQLLKDQCLGIGAYGAVCKAKCDDLVCAAKIIHPTLFDPTALQQVAPQREHRLPIRRFEQECEFMSAIRHPN